MTKRSPSSSPEFSVREFFARFPDNDACLEHVMRVRFGLRHTCRKCGVVDATFHKMSDRKAYACSHCGDHVYPCAGTIFQDSRTPLQSWFYAIYLFVVTRHGVSGKELQRALGVTYKTGYRIGMQIRKLMGKADGFDMLKGHVELDETYVGGYRPNGQGGAGKTIVMGLKQRGGRLATEVVPDTTTPTLRGAFYRHVEPGTVVSTDQHRAYRLLDKEGFVHGVVNHSRDEYAMTDEHGNRHHTNFLEGFWKLFKDSVRSTHIHVSSKHMQTYLDEFTFRSNNRAKVNGMFDLLISVV